MKRIIAAALSLIVIISGTSLAADPADGKTDAPRIQLAILLDTSNSMDGLIHQAKAQLWKVVNEFLFAKQGGKQPKLEVALYEYGKKTLPASEGFIRMVTPFTDDFDDVSAKLWGLTTNGGQEYCGHVIQMAMNELEWSARPDDLKVIFIAGNEGFDQGSVDFRTACAEAIAAGVLVNTIFCGNEAEGVRTHWAAGAQLADGSFMNIDQNQALADIVAPQDVEIRKLGADLNKTYIAYGANGTENWRRQTAQDKNSADLSNDAAVQRMVCKSSSNYFNGQWDLVDGVETGTVKLEELDESELPENMRKMTLEERRAHVQSMKKSRGGLQKQIQQLNEQRAKFVAARQKELAGENAKTLDQAMGECIRAQASRKQIQLEAPAAAVETSAGEGGAGESEKTDSPKKRVELTQEAAPTNGR